MSIYHGVCDVDSIKNKLSGTGWSNKITLNVPLDVNVKVGQSVILIYDKSLPKEKIIEKEVKKKKIKSK